MIKKLIVCSSVLLAACGGGGGDDGGGGGTKTGPLVEGQFKDAAIEGVVYPSDTWQSTGTYGTACYDETHYFETDDGRIRVYGSTAFSETDFKVVATMIDERLDSVISKFGITWAEYVQERETFNIDHVSSLASYYLSLYMGNNPGSGYSGTDDEAWALWSSLTTQEQLNFARDEYVALDDRVAMKDVLLPKEQVVVCFNEKMSGAQFGEGSQYGIQVPPNTSTYSGGVGEIFTHELVHFVQQNITNVGQDPYSIMPRWFSEGQATYLAGMSVASVDHHYNADPVEVVSFFDEDEMGVDTGTAYEHYALAYKYLEENNERAAIVNMMIAMKSNTDTPQSRQPAKVFDPNNPDAKDEGLSFTRAFDSRMKDHTGASLTIERYRTTYHDLMNSWK